MGSHPGAALNNTILVQTESWRLGTGILTRQVKLETTVHDTSSMKLMTTKIRSYFPQSNKPESAEKYR